jgi:phosphatidylinositol glycan class B
MRGTVRVSDSSDERRLALFATLALLLAALPRLWAAWFDDGIFWPDEILQSLEQAHRLVFGYGIVPWEFRRGARSWLFPGMLAFVLDLGSLAGLRSGRSLVLLIKTCMAACSIVGLYLSMRLARTFAGNLAALVTALLGGFFAASILLGSRCSPEVVSGPVLMAVVLLAMRSGALPQVAAGALAGFSIHLRYQNGLIALGVLVITLSERRFRDAAYYTGAAFALGLVGGLLDWLTWGAPFAAFRKYLWFNLRKSAHKFGAYPFYYYAQVAWQISGPALLAIVAGLLWSARLAPKLLALVLGYVIVHSLVPHKEFRFLLPILPLVFALVGAGLADALARLRGGQLMAAALAAVCALSMGYSTLQLTWQKLGFPSDRGARSPWHSGEGINRLLSLVGQRPDVCGVMVTGESFGWIGGYSYLHRDVNLYADSYEPERASANYLIALAGVPAPPGYREQQQVREFVLSRREGPCAPAPAGYTRELPY